MKERAASPSSVVSTRRRLLEGAARVFARDGIAGSTTREIAREAGVNEVTLFRHFQTKDRLIAAVIGENFGVDAMQSRLSPSAPDADLDLRSDLTDHARRYEQLLKENLPLIRTMIGEIHHHADQERQVYRAIFRPLRETLVARIEKALGESRGAAKGEAEMLADLFSGMIFMGTLRRNSPHVKLEYSAGVYLAAAVDLTVRAAEAGAPT